MASLRLYISLGIKYAFIALVISVAVHIALKYTVLKGKTTEKKTELFRFAALWYFLTLEFVVLTGRSSPILFPTSSYNLHLFENLRAAIRETSVEALIQVGLNVLMFVPGGFLLCHVLREKKVRFAPLMVLALVAVNESIQFFTGIGCADIDDVFSNLLGALWGMAIWFFVIHFKRKSQKKYFAGAVSVMPLLAAAVLFIYYAFRPIGYLPQEVINPEYLKAEIVDVRALESTLPESVKIYRQEIHEKSEVDEKVKLIFNALGEKISDDDRDIYDSCMVYRDDSSSYIWYYYTGAFDLDITNLTPAMPYPELELTERCLALLNDMGCPLPMPSRIDERNHIFYFDFEPLENKVYDGEVDFNFSAFTPEDELLLCELKYEITELEGLGDYSTADTGQIVQKLRAGQFSITGMATPENIREIVCKDYELDYMADSKGFYRPVYIISCLVDGAAAELTVAA